MSSWGVISYYWTKTVLLECSKVVCVRKRWQKAKTVPSSSTLVPDSSGPFTINLHFFVIMRSYLIYLLSMHSYSEPCFLIKKNLSLAPFPHDTIIFLFFSLSIAHHQFYLHFLICQLQSGFFSMSL